MPAFLGLHVGELLLLFRRELLDVVGAREVKVLGGVCPASILTFSKRSTGFGAASFGPLMNMVRT